jgi:ribosomal protein S18 acetylase RimI-like enzyme
MPGKTTGQLMVIFEWSDLRNMLFWWIQGVYVPEKWRKQGVFRSLYHHLEQMARYRKEVAGMRLYAEHNNQAAQDTYERPGMHNPGYLMYEILL